MAEAAFDLYAEAVAAIGSGDTVEVGTISAREIARFAVAVGDSNPIYFDVEAARAAGYPDVVVPPNCLGAVIGWEGGPPEDELRPDGTAQQDLGFIDLHGARLMGGGQDLVFHAPVCAGDRITLTRRLTDVQKRAGRSGDLILLQLEKRYTNQRDEMVLVISETLIVR